ncbi:MULTISPECIES: TetR/AcrR family transcriptional regulator [unclassified Streptomyces]|uniref:TetR/AcrR family transcriptional regulator n=1 Tax=unclassified Streptomyces TaxID=2593676 RepID=UPI0037F3AFA7
MSTATPSAPRTERSAATREAIMAAAERLFAEHGLSSVSLRQIADAAGQRNVTAVGYHFGTKTDLVHALMARHSEPVDALRNRYVAEAEGTGDLRMWVRALVRPATDHLRAQGVPSWNARLTAQVMTDPQLRALVTTEALGRPSLRRILDGIGPLLRDQPAAVRAVRGDMACLLIIHTCADRERALAEQAPSLHGSWDEMGDALTDALLGLFTAPSTAPRA